MKIKLYIAEDFPMQVALLKAIFEGDPRFTAQIFSDGLDLYLKVLEDPPDVLVLDIILPSLSGLAIARLLRFDQRFRKIPILITSSITDVDIREQAQKMGADTFLPKPFQPSDLIENLLKLVA